VRILRRSWLDIVAVLVSLFVFIVPFVFMFLMAVKDADDASDFSFTWPKRWAAWSNINEVFNSRDGVLITAFKNSTLLTIAAVVGVVVVASMAAFVIERRPGRVARSANFLLLAGLMIPPAIVPTIWVLQKLHLYKSVFGLALVEIAFGMPFSVLVFRGFISTIPRDLDEAALIDGCTGFNLFFRVIFPLLRPVTVTISLVTAVFVFNDFVNPLYFLPGSGHETVQLTLFNFVSQFTRNWNLLFMDMLIITVPPLVLYTIFNRKIVAGMTSGAVKG
jgi:raffinose/stachyose/melibiose transport system permease protein